MLRYSSHIISIFYLNFKVLNFFILFYFMEEIIFDLFFFFTSTIIASIIKAWNTRTVWGRLTKFSSTLRAIGRIFRAFFALEIAF
jgi:hypothetical protein